VGAELFHAEGWVNRQEGKYDEAKVNFRNFAYVPKNSMRAHVLFDLSMYLLCMSGFW
jgi:hypothetical protein